MLHHALVADGLAFGKGALARPVVFRFAVQDLLRGAQHVPWDPVIHGFRAVAPKEACLFVDGVQELLKPVAEGGQPHALFLRQLDKRRARRETVACQGIVLLPVHQRDRALRVAGDRDDLQPPAAEIEHVAVVQFMIAEALRHHDMFLAVGLELFVDFFRLSVRADAEHVAHAPLVGERDRKQRLVLFAHIDLVKQRRRARVIRVAVRHDAHDRLVGKRFDKGAQRICHAKAAVDKRRSFAADHEIHHHAPHGRGRVFLLDSIKPFAELRCVIDRVVHAFFSFIRSICENRPSRSKTYSGPVPRAAPPSPRASADGGNSSKPGAG